LRQLADELSRKDRETFLSSGVLTDYCLTHNEKDNTSASENSKSVAHLKRDPIPSVHVEAAQFKPKQPIIADAMAEENAEEDLHN